MKTANEYGGAEKLKALAMKYGVTFKAKDFTPENPIIRDIIHRTIDVVGVTNMELAFRAIRIHPDNVGEAVKLALQLKTEKEDTESLGPMFQDREEKTWEKRRERRLLSSKERLQIVPFDNLQAILPLLRMVAHNCFVTSMFHTDQGEKVKINKTKFEYDLDPLRDLNHAFTYYIWNPNQALGEACSGNWVPDTWQHPACENIQNNWEDFLKTCSVSCSYANLSVSEISNGYCEAMIAFSANKDHAFLFKIHCGEMVKPLYYRIKLAIWIHLIESGLLSNPAFKNPRKLDSGVDYSECDGMY